MIIIVEGIDRVGKTTLCNALSESLNIPIYKHSQKILDYASMDNVNETDKMIQLLELCDISNIDIIFDRFHFSDYVYGIIERQYDKIIAEKNLLVIDEILSRMNAIIIHMCPTDISSSSEQHGSDLTPYFELMNRAHDVSKTFVYECDYLFINHMLDEIKEIINAKSRI